MPAKQVTSIAAFPVSSHEAVAFPDPQRTPRPKEVLLFQPGTHTMVWMDHGRARATFQFTLRDSTGKTLWQGTIKRDAFAWSDNPAAPSQQRELPEKIAAALVRKLKDRW